MHENDQAPGGDERDDTSGDSVEPGPASDRPQAADDPADEPDGLDAHDVAHLARLLPDTNVWNQVAASTRWLDQIRTSTRWLDQIRTSTRWFDQIRASTRVFEQAAASARLFDQVSARARAFEQAARVTSAWKPIAIVSPLAQITATYQALDKLRIGAAMMPASAWTPSWEAWSAAASIGAWQIPTWTAPTGFMPWAASNLFTVALPDVWRHDLYDVLRRIRETLDKADEYLGGLFFAALDARDAVLNDPDSPKVVRRFARTWLGIRNITQYVLDAVVDVLLSDDWHELDVTEDELREHLRARTRDRHAIHRPVFERQLGGRPIGSLSAQLHTDVGVLTLDQAVAGTHDTEHEALQQQWADSRLAPLLDKLTPLHRRVVDVIASNGLGWYEAADVAGVTPAEVEATRRRVKYLAAEQKRRAAAQ
jgi:DNA-directed RNA polymerase specialized sigma24 family protein